MYIDDLLSLFEEASAKYPVLSSGIVRDELRQAILAKKYDLQDEALIEAILKEDHRELTSSFTESLDRILENQGEGISNDEFLSSDEGKREAIRLYIASLEHLINFYYNSLVGKHFSST